MDNALPLSLYCVGDAYANKGNIMGRHAAGKGIIKAIATGYSTANVGAIGYEQRDGKDLLLQLQGNGFSGTLQWNHIPTFELALQSGVLYIPAPPMKNIAASRNLVGTNAFSLMGVTHTISSVGIMEQLAELIFEPFQEWDALICTSQAVKDLITTYHDDLRQYWHQSTGAHIFNAIQLPIIPLGVHTPDFEFSHNDRNTSRAELQLATDTVTFLFAGRLSFHGKANPIAVYQALEKLSKVKKVVCIEAGIYANEAVKKAYQDAQELLAPSVKFIWVDGTDEQKYCKAWQAADIFVSLSDNIQESFGLTPIEAMAAGLPVVVTDWDGYKDTVRDGIDGFRIPTLIPEKGAGVELANRYFSGTLTYDYYIGRASLATVVEIESLYAAFERLALNPLLRQQMGDAGKKRVKESFDWQQILARYTRLSKELNALRPKADLISSRTPHYADPFLRFSNFPTSIVGQDWQIQLNPDANARLKDILSLAMVNYVFDTNPKMSVDIESLVSVLVNRPPIRIGDLPLLVGLSLEKCLLTIMWLAKFDLIKMRK